MTINVLACVWTYKSRKKIASAGLPWYKFIAKNGHHRKTNKKSYKAHNAYKHEI